MRAIYVDLEPRQLVDEMVILYDDLNLLDKPSEALLVKGERKDLDKLKGPITDYKGTDTIRGRFGLPPERGREVEIGGQRYEIVPNGFHSP